MASSQTSNYKLNQWAASDKFLRTEFNSDNSKIDAALKAINTLAEGKPDVTFGTYVGNDAATRTVSLGFTPRAVLVMRQDGTMNDSYLFFGGLALEGVPVMARSEYPVVTVSSGGFQVYITRISSSYHVQSNSSNYTYLYLALK